jgi:hypothetical protein
LRVFAPEEVTSAQVKRTVDLIITLLTVDDTIANAVQADTVRPLAVVHPTRRALSALAAHEVSAVATVTNFSLVVKVVHADVVRGEASAVTLYAGDVTLGT